MSIQGNMSLSADLNCLNMLFVIQMRNLKLWGPCLKKLNLTEPEFLHPQTLNPFALQCNQLGMISFNRHGFYHGNMKYKSKILIWLITLA